MKKVIRNKSEEKQPLQEKGENWRSEPESRKRRENIVVMVSAVTERNDEQLVRESHHTSAAHSETYRVHEKKKMKTTRKGMMMKVKQKKQSRKVRRKRKQRKQKWMKRLACLVVVAIAVGHYDPLAGMHSDRKQGSHRIQTLNNPNRRKLKKMSA